MKPEQRDYNLSDADLAMLASNYVVFMTRDATEFATRGVDALAITAFETLGNAFEVFHPDEYYQAEVSGEVEAKNVARSSATASIQFISGFFEQKWGLDNFRYKKLKIKGLHDMSDNDFLITARNVVDVATEFIADLVPIGLAQTDIDALEAVAQTFEDTKNGVTTKKALRDEKTEERTEKGNELYGFVKQYSTIGKLVWENVSEAKYNDYVIYHTTTQMPGKVLNMAWDYPSKTVSWDAAAHADSYQLERKFSSDPDWTVVYEGADTSVVNDPVTPGTWFFRCRGQNAEGYGSWSDELMVLMPV